MAARTKRLAILGTRGVPARHGGFETLAERLARFLHGRGWAVAVYCQAAAPAPTGVDTWEGLERVHIAPRLAGALGTGEFDLRAALHAAGRWPLQLVLGYNTAIFSVVSRLRGRVVLMNMDGMEWQRGKWTWPYRAWLRFNERAGCVLANHLIADHPHIREHLLGKAASAKISTIAYGADRLDDADAAILEQWRLRPFGYVSLVARPEPENSVLEMVRAFSRRRRGMQLLVLGAYDRSRSYPRRVLDAASDEVVFAGAIYEPAAVGALRFHSALYLHGHRVGGTNPSLVEALGAGNPVLAHDNRFNRWVAGPGAAYFADEDGCARRLDELLAHPDRLDAMRAASRARHAEAFTWERILLEYEALLARWAGIAAKEAGAVPADAVD